MFDLYHSHFESVSISALPPTQQSLYRHEGVVGLDLSHCLWIGKERNVQSPKTQGGFPISHRITNLSQPYDPETFSPPNGSFSFTQIEKTSPPITLVYGSKTLSSYTIDLRFGLYYPNHLIYFGNSNGSDNPAPFYGQA